MITTAKATTIKDRILDLKEKTIKQNADLLNEIEIKNRRIYKIFNDDSYDSKLRAHAYSFGITFIFEVLQKANAHRLLQENLKAKEIATQREDLIKNIYKQVNERLSIIEKAEKHDLQDFLKENDVYSIFEYGKLENFLNKESLFENQKIDKKINSKGKFNER